MTFIGEICARLTGRLTEDGGPLDLSKGDGVVGEGGVEGVEARWLENLEPDVRDAYKRAKGKPQCICGS